MLLFVLQYYYIIAVSLAQYINIPRAATDLVQLEVIFVVVFLSKTLMLTHASKMLKCP